MKLRSSLLAIAAAALLTGAVSLSQASNASAATTPASHSSHGVSSPTRIPRKGVSPNVNNFLSYTEINFGGNPFWAYPCVAGQVYTAADPIASAKNNCEYHVYLQYADGSSFCIDPHSSRTDIGSQYRNPSTVQIGPGTSAC